MTDRSVKLHLGCGRQYKAGFVNIDLYDLSVADIAAETVTLPFADDSVDLIEAHHLIEHYPYAQINALLAEWHRVLRIGSKLIIETPDFEQVMRLFLEDRDSQRWVFWHVVLYGGQQDEGQFHKSPQTFERLKSNLETLGFERVERGTAVSSFPGHNYNENMRIEATKTRPRFRPEAAGPTLSSALAGLGRRLDEIYPYQDEDVVSFLKPGEAKLSSMRLEYAGQSRYAVDVILLGSDGQHAQVWQGFGVPIRNATPERVELPSVLDFLPRQFTDALRAAIAQVPQWIERERPQGSLTGFNVNLEGGIDLPAENARVIVPGMSTNERCITDMRTYQLAREIAAERDVLVLGCGTGPGSKLLATAAKSCLAVEFEQRFLEHAVRTYPATNIVWMAGGLQLLELAGRHFDFVVLPCLLEYVSETDRETITRQLPGFLKPGGMIMLSANNSLQHDGKYSLPPTKGLTSRVFRQLVSDVAANRGRVSYCGQLAPADSGETNEQSMIKEGFRPDDDRIVALVEF